MRTLEKMISLSVLGSVLVSSVQASERGKNLNEATPGLRPSAPTAAATPLKTSAAPGDAVNPRPDSTANNPEQEQGKPQRPGRSSREIAEEAQKIAEEVKQARIDFLKQQQDLKKDRRRVMEAGRDQIRAQVKANRGDFSTLQPGAPQDVRQQLVELMEKLPQHKETLENAQSEAKDKAKKRKDH